MAASVVTPPAVIPARTRFVFTVGMNLLRSGVSFTTGMLVARWLGPTRFGSFAFLIGTFSGLRALLDMGTSSAFFTFLSQRPRSWRFVRSFLSWMAVQFTVPLLVIAVLLPSGWVATVWRGEPRSLVVLAFAAAFMQNSVWPVVQQSGEAQRRTYLVQSIGLVVVTLHLAAVAVFWWLGAIGLYAILAAIAVEYLLAAVFALSRLSYAADDPLQAREPVLSRYVRFCLPLVPFAAVGFANEFADRWMLQRFGGGVQQAYYAVGAQLASVALIATSSILSIFWKEIAEANHRGDHERTGQLYRRVSRLLYFAGAGVAGLLIPWSRDLLQMLLGAPYVGGATTLMIMLLYPIHQSMGQIGATMMYATERVGLQVAIGTCTTAFGITMTYLVLAPPSATIPGLGLASTGLAIKMVGTQVLSVNILAFVIARISGWRFDWVYQPAVLTACLLAGWAAHALVTFTMPDAIPLPLRLACAGSVYALLLGGLVYLVPGLAGLTRAEIVRDVRRALVLAGVQPSG